MPNSTGVLEVRIVRLHDRHEASSFLERRVPGRIVAMRVGCFSALCSTTVLTKAMSFSCFSGWTTECGPAELVRKVFRDLGDDP